LLLWNEPVQDYDCHFADYIREDSRTVAEKWGAVLTDALVDFINRSSQGSRGGKITRVYDLLSDSSYQSVFDWERLAGTGSRIYHRIFKADAGPDSLSKIATILVRHLDEICDGRPEFDKWLRLISIRGSSFEFSFEKSLNKNAEAAREGLLLTERQVLDQNRWLALECLQRSSISGFSPSTIGGRFRLRATATLEQASFLSQERSKAFFGTK
jgi:hypothetical protein